MARNWSVYQQAVFDFVANNTQSVVINAVAGSGKTTTIVECASRESQKGKSILFLAFNKSIATELEGRMKPFGVECKTLHSFGNRALFCTFGNGLTTNQYKWRDYIKDNIDILTNYDFGDNENLKASYIRNCCALLDVCRINLIKSNQMNEIKSLAEHHNVELIDDEVYVVSDILQKCYTLSTDNVIDFTDMITLPVTDINIGRRVKKYDIVFIDECQDLSKAQQQLMLKAVKPGGKFVAVGDPMQAINGFAGADCDSFNNLVKIAGNELPLSVCYRCGSLIIEHAQSIVPYIQSFEGAAPGEIRKTETLTDVKPGDMIICRKSAPLVGLALKFIAAGKSAQVKGRDIAEGLKNLIIKNNPKNISYLFQKLEKQLDSERRKAIKAGKPAECPSVTGLQDKIDCIRIIAESCNSVNEIITKLDTLFNDSLAGNVIQLSTIHKSKGLEASNVFIALPDKLPMMYKGQQAWEYEQELNLKYVAITRAKSVLTYITLGEDELAAYTFDVEKKPRKKRAPKTEQAVVTETTDVEKPKRRPGRPRKNA